MAKLNLFYVIDDLMLGGPTIFVTTLKWLDKKKYNISVCCLFGGGELVPEVEKLGIKVFILGFRRWKPYLILKLAWLMRRNRTQIVHTHLFGSNTIGRLAAILARIPVIITTMHHMAKMDSPLRLLTERFFSYLTQQIITVSEAVRISYKKQAHISLKKMRTMYNSIDLEKFDLSRVKPLKKRQELGLSPHSFLIGTVSSLYRVKGHRYLIEAIPSVLAKFPDTKFIMVGRGGLRETLEKQCQDLAVSHSVIFLGLRNDIPELTALFDLVVLPSLTEGLPSVLLEAMALKKAVVATRTGGIPEVVLDGRTGLLVPPADAKSLARAIITLLKDKDLREKIGQRGYERVREYFNPQRRINQLEALYDKLWKYR